MKTLILFLVLSLNAFAFSYDDLYEVPPENLPLVRTQALLHADIFSGHEEFESLKVYFLVRAELAKHLYERYQQNPTTNSVGPTSVRPVERSEEPSGRLRVNSENARERNLSTRVDSRVGRNLK